MNGWMILGCCIVGAAALTLVWFVFMLLFSNKEPRPLTQEEIDEFDEFAREYREKKELKKNKKKS